MSIDRLRAHYGFERMPFSKHLAPGMLHAHRAHQQAVARISWCVAERQIGVISGECGSGKTVAARAAVAGARYIQAHDPLLGDPGCGFARPLRLDRQRSGWHPQVSLLGVDPASPGAARRRGARSAQRQVLLLIDEAHLLDAESLEGLRCLQNADMDQATPFTLLLLGQPTLRRRLRLGAFAALDQRVGLRYTIAGLEADETAGYIAHHLKLAGRSDTLFSDDAVALIHQVSRGLPRLVNNLAVQSLVADVRRGQGDRR